MDGGDASDLPPGQARCFSGNRLRRAQRILAYVQEAAEEQAF